MKILGINMTEQTAFIVGGLSLLWLVSSVNKANATLDQAGAALGLSNKNILYNGINDSGSILSSNDGYDLGYWLQSALNPNGNNKTGTNVIKLPTQGGGATGSW